MNEVGRRFRTWVTISALAAISSVPWRLAAAEPTELQKVLQRIMAPPQIRAVPGFSARILIAPGQSKLYDPLFMRDQAGVVWINDSGAQKGGRGGQILAIDQNGNISDVVALGRLLPLTGFDVAPASFAPYEGEIFTVSQREVGLKGAQIGYVVHRIDPTTQDSAELFCTLPPAGGLDNSGTPAVGIEGRFGPEGSPFAGKFFAATAENSTVYRVTTDRQCTPFVTLDQQKWGQASGLEFSPDGQYMLVSTLGKGTIVRVRADGVVDAQPLVRTSSPINFFGMAHAPAGFGAYAGELFVTAYARDLQKGVQELHKTDAMPPDGALYRVGAKGELKLVASGFHFPVGVHFVGKRLWVSDINGDFLGQVQRELPDGLLVEIVPSM